MGNDYGQPGRGSGSTEQYSAGTYMNQVMDGVELFLRRDKIMACLITLLPFSIGLLAYTRHERCVHQTGFIIFFLIVSHLWFFIVHVLFEPNFFLVLLCCLLYLCMFPLIWQGLLLCLKMSIEEPNGMWVLYFFNLNLSCTHIHLGLLTPTHPTTEKRKENPHRGP